MTSPALPLELASLCASLLPDRASLASLASVSRSWRTAALPHLWRRVVIDGASCATWQRAVWRCQFLLENVYATQHVRYAVLHGDWGEGLAYLFRQLIFRLVPQLDGLFLHGHKLMFEEAALLTLTLRMKILRLGEEGHCHRFERAGHDANDGQHVFAHMLSLYKNHGGGRRAIAAPIRVDMICSPQAFHLVRSFNFASRVYHLRISTIAAGAFTLKKVVFPHLVALTVDPCRCRSKIPLHSAFLGPALSRMPRLASLIVRGINLANTPVNQLLEALATVTNTLMRLHLDPLTLDAIHNDQPQLIFDELADFLGRLSLVAPRLVTLDLVIAGAEFYIVPADVYPRSERYQHGSLVMPRLRHFGINLIGVLDNRVRQVCTSFLDFAELMYGVEGRTAVNALLQRARVTLDQFDDTRAMAPRLCSFASPMGDGASVRDMAFVADIVETGIEGIALLRTTFRTYPLHTTGADP